VASTMRATAPPEIVGQPLRLPPAHGQPVIQRIRAGEAPALQSPEHDAGIDSAEAERVAQDVIDCGVATVLRDDVEIADRIGIFPV